MSLGIIDGLIQATAKDLVPPAVDEWLDDHPEATTTVEDGAITKAKLDSDLQETVDDVSSLKSAINVIWPDARRKQAIMTKKAS